MSTTQAQQVAKQVVKKRQSSPAYFFETMHAYQQTAALKTPLELDWPVDPPALAPEIDVWTPRRFPAR